MNTKIVYVVISDQEDYYLEQALISVHSCRAHNGDAHIALITDERTLDTCKEGARARFLKYFDSTKIIDTSQFATKIKRSRFIKTNLRNIIDGDYLYIDCDTVVCDRLDDIDDFKGDIGFVYDYNLDDDCQRQRYWESKTKKAKDKDVNVKYMFNGGVEMVRDVPQAYLLYDTWHDEWLKAQALGQDRDQPPLYKALSKTGVNVTPLPNQWNCMLWGFCLECLTSAKVLHISPHARTTPFHPLMENDVLEKIRQTGEIDHEVDRMIRNPFTVDMRRYNRIGENTVATKHALLLWDVYCHDDLYLYYNAHRFYKFVNFIPHSCLWIKAQLDKLR